MKIKGNHLKKWGLPSGPVYAVALKLLKDTGIDRTVAEGLIKGIVTDPEAYLQGPYAPIAQALMKKKEPETKRLRDHCVPNKVFGAHLIEGGALAQLYTAAKLPISVQAALMPDGHQGYGLPIGGVLATDNAVIPYAVGVDIGCRMHMTVLDTPASRMKGMHDRLVNIITDNTVFGAGVDINTQVEHPILDDQRFGDIPCVRKARLRDKACVQLGTSGGGNHFVEFGTLEMPGMDEPHMAILSHSGSRGVGFQIAKLYTQIAMDNCKLQRDARHLAWLDMDSEDGQEYWEAMNLSGEFAKACHEIIHRRLVKALKASPEMVIQNHHNFAWKEQLPDGRDVIVHRKGATPAGEGKLGLIPGSMSSYSYIVKGKGNPESLCSSSHGAGRAMSRKAAKEQFTMSWLKKDLQEKGVTLIGGAVDECRGGYKDIELVMPEQADLVDIHGRFMPYIVRMAGEQKKKW
jgi:tRNA-splicing ligase RtcB